MTEPGFRDRLQIRVLEIAQRIVDQDGLSGMQARRIAREADCSVGTLYNLFDGLDGLIMAANAETLRLFGERAATAMRRAALGSVEAQLLAAALAYLDFAVAHPQRLRAVFEHRLANPAGQVSKAYLADQARLFALIEAPLANAINSHDERRSIARGMFAAVHGVVLMALDRKLGPFDAAATERQVRFVVGAMAAAVERSRPAEPQ